MCRHVEMFLLLIKIQTRSEAAVPVFSVYFPLNSRDYKFISLATRYIFAIVWCLLFHRMCYGNYTFAKQISPTCKFPPCNGYHRSVKQI